MAVRRTARIHTGALEGIDGIAVTAEVDISRGLPGFYLVGLPNAEVRESRERVLSALRNSGQKIPLGKITVNLAPAGVRKTGASCDLAMAMGVLAAGRAMRLGPTERTEATYLGELSLFGEVRPVRGLLALVMEAAADGCARVVVPAAQVAEARLVSAVEAVGVHTLAEAVAWWEGGAGPREEAVGADTNPDQLPPLAAVPDLLWSDLAGQPLVRKGAVMAAAGGHHCLLVGPPGTGKTRLARTLGQLGPPLSRSEALEVTRIQSAAGRSPGQGLVQQRPFRAPHHSVTRAGLVGGGAGLRPGEVTMAHEGVLFLDEVSEFAPAVLDGLREPLEDARVTMVRGNGARTYPANFQLVAAMNPCRCGFLGSETRACTCNAADIKRHRTRLSGPILDRIDIFLEVGAWEGAFLTRGEAHNSSSQADNWRDFPRLSDLIRAGAVLREWRQGTLLDRLSERAAHFLDGARQPLGLSLRGMERCVAVAATAAALDGTEVISGDHVREALEFRQEVLLV
jgi:magnesium chelatase family protein